MFFTIKMDWTDTQYFLRDLVLAPLGLKCCILALICPTFGQICPTLSPICPSFIGFILLWAQFVLPYLGHLSYPTLGGKGNLTPAFAFRSSLGLRPWELLQTKGYIWSYIPRLVLIRIQTLVVLFKISLLFSYGCSTPVAYFWALSSNKWGNLQSVLRISSLCEPNFPLQFNTPSKGNENVQQFSRVILWKLNSWLKKHDIILESFTRQSHKFKLFDKIIK